MPAAEGRGRGKGGGLKTTTESIQKKSPILSHVLECPRCTGVLGDAEAGS